MSAVAAHTGDLGVCASCRRRSWLLGELSGALEYVARDRRRLLDVLALDDARLMRAVAGRRATEVGTRYRRFGAQQRSRMPAEGAICRHARRYPSSLSGPFAPALLEVLGGTERLVGLADGPLVAILGSRLASDYGMEMSRELARGLSAAGVSVTASLADGVAVAAHAGALEASGRAVAVLPGGLSAGCPARRRSLLARVIERGCAISELPSSCSARRWGQLASERIVVALADAVVIVEAADSPGDLEAARIASLLGRPLGAVPGRATSPLSSGAHRLLREGVKLIRGPHDVLDLLALDIESISPMLPLCGMSCGLEPRLAALLDRVAGGGDTPEKLTRGGAAAHEVLLGLSELEAMDLVRRGDGGRYLARAELPSRR